MRIRWSKSGATIGFFFLVLLLLYLAILPYGDEPDFTFQVPYYIVLLDSVNLSYYSDGISSISDCKYLHNPYQIFGMYDYDSCVMSPELSVKRALFSYLLYMPLILISIFNYSSNTSKTILNGYYFHNKSIQLTLLVPSFVYYASLFSHEQVTLMLSMLTVFTLLRARYLISIALLIIIASIDKGNAIVVSLVLIYILLSTYIYRRFGYKTTLIVNILCIAVAYIASSELLYLFRPFSLKVDQILFNLEANYVNDKYPLWLRPFLTFMTFNFMAPSLSKHPLLYLLTGFSLVYVIFKIRYLKQTLGVIDKEYLIVAFAAFSMILIIVFILPGYNNAKYYIFTLPIFLNTILRYVSFFKLVNFIVICNLIVFIDYLLFYAIGCSACNPYPYNSVTNFFKDMNINYFTGVIY